MEVGLPDRMVPTRLGSLHHRHPLVVVAEEGEVQVGAAAVGLGADGQLAQQPPHRLGVAAVLGVHDGVFESGGGHGAVQSPSRIVISQLDKDSVGGAALAWFTSHSHDEGCGMHRYRLGMAKLTCAIRIRQRRKQTLSPRRFLRIPAQPMDTFFSFFGQLGPILSMFGKFDCYGSKINQYKCTFPKPNVDFYAVFFTFTVSRVQISNSTCHIVSIWRY